MNLTRLTITGADNDVDQQALIDLSAEFPFVEWGVLCSLSHNVERTYESWRPRFPSHRWQDNLCLQASARGVDVKIATHYCGELSRRILAGHKPDDLGGWSKRAQLNGFSEFRIPMLRVAQIFSEVEFIFQVQTQSALEHAAALAKLHPNVSVLIDESAGSGKESMIWWTVPEILQGRCGHAGGITPDNIVSRLTDMKRANAIYSWADSETGARTDDKFDLAKARRLLELTQPFVVQP